MNDMNSRNETEKELVALDLCKKVMSRSRDEDDTDCDLTESYSLSSSASFSIDSSYLIQEVSSVESPTISPAEDSSILDDEASFDDDDDDDLLGGLCVPRVRFNTKPQASKSASSRADAHRLWYNAQDYDNFKKANGLALRKLVMGREETSLCCKRALRKLTKRVQGAVSDQDTTPKTKMDKASEQKLDEMYRRLATEEIVGLEPFVVRVLFQDGRKVRLARLLDRIEMLSTRSDYMAPDLAAEELRNACISVSRPSRLFAAAIAQARQRNDYD